MEKKNRLLKTSAVVLIAIILAKLAALGEDTIVASFIGTSGSADAYYMSADILQLFWYFGTLGIVRVYLPEYKSQLTLYGTTQAEKYSSNMRCIFSIFAILITGIVVFFAFPLVNVMAYGFSSVDKEACVKFVRLRAPQIMFWCWASLATAKLQSQDKFIPSKIPEIVVHIPVIVFSTLLFTYYGIYTLFAGLFVGSLLGFLVQLPFLRKELSLKIAFHINEKGVKESLKRMPAAFVSAALTQIHSLVDKVMASAQPVGSVSVLSYSHKMYSAVNGLISGAISTVAYPKITAYAATNDRTSLENFVRSILLLLLLLLLPFSIAFALFSPDLTKLLFMRGVFGEDSVLQVSSVFSAYVIGISFAGINTIIQLVFFAYGNTKVPMYTSIISIGCNIVLNLLLVSFWGTKGIALASSIALIVAFVCLTVKVKSYIRIFNRDFTFRTLKIIVSALISCIIAYIIAGLYLSSVAIFVKLIISAVIGITVYCSMIILWDKDIIYILRIL